MGFRLMLYCRDFCLLYLVRILRMVSSGLMLLVLYQHLFYKGLIEFKIGILQAVIVVGDVVVSLYFTSKADRIGRRITLIITSIINIITGIIFTDSDNYVIFVIVGAAGVISVTGREVGSFSVVEQSALRQLVKRSTEKQEEVEDNIVKVMSRYKVVGYISQAMGSALAGFFIKYSLEGCKYQFEAIVDLFKIYTGIAGIMLVLYFCLSENIEQSKAPDPPIISFSDIKGDIKCIVTLNKLVLLDGFAHAFLVQSCISYYYQFRYNLQFYELGVYLFIITIITTLSRILSSYLAQHLGKLTMVFLHCTSNFFLLLIPFTSNVNWSISFLFLNFLLSGMKKHPRQDLNYRIISPSARLVNKNLKKISFGLGLAGGLILNGTFLNFQECNNMTFSTGLLIAGIAKIIYDVALGLLLFFNRDHKEMMEVISNEEITMEEEVELEKIEKE